MSPALIHLSQDPILAPLLSKYDPPEWYGTGDYFTDLCEIVTNQQLSYHSGKKIFARFMALFNHHPSPESVKKIGDSLLRTCGYSKSKIKYLQNIASAILDKSLDQKNLINLSDLEVEERLTKIKGLGPWSAHMFMIFSLRRPDIFSIGDIGLRTAISRLYHIDREDKSTILKIASTWSPYRSTACRYLWNSLI